MIQDIGPSVFHNEYRHIRPRKDDVILMFDSGGAVLCSTSCGRIAFPDIRENDDDAVYLFSIDDTGYFLYRGPAVQKPEGYDFYRLRELRSSSSGPEVFAAFTAYHLWRWYEDNRFCGSCASPMTEDTKERALVCTKCGRIVYPRINPAVIVGVIKDDRLLITRYNRGYSHDALIAGFAEIGETLEQTVAREVMEEAGIRVKNIRYYRSQPWGMAQDLLAGFFCEQDGDDPIRVDDSELASAVYKSRDQIELQSAQLSLTNEMMTVFKEDRAGQEIKW